MSYCLYWPHHLFAFVFPTLTIVPTYPLSDISVIKFVSLKLARNTCKLDRFHSLPLKKQISSCKGQGNFRYRENCGDKSAVRSWERCEIKSETLLFQKEGTVRLIMLS